MLVKCPVVGNLSGLVDNERVLEGFSVLVARFSSRANRADAERSECRRKSCCRVNGRADPRLEQILRVPSHKLIRKVATECPS